MRAWSEVLTEFEDGRLNILAEGGERFRLDELTDGRAFHTGLVSPVLDEDDPAGDAAIAEALRLFERLREVTESEVDVPEPETAATLVCSRGGRSELSSETKLELLSELSERRRVERVQDLLADAVLTAQRIRRAAERAATNGKVDLG